MTALARLLARATGQAAPGLRPRLPARFETPGAEPPRGFETVSTESAPAPGERSAEPAGPASSRRAPRAQAIDRPRAQGERTTPAHTSFEAADLPPKTSPPKGITPGRRPASPPPLMPEPGPKDLADAPGAATTDDAMAAGPAPRAAAPRSAETQEPAPPRRRVDLTLGPLPEPLLPPVPPRRAPAPHEARPDAPRLSGTTASSTARVAAAPEPPEITVHIGRLHVVTEPQKSRTVPERPRRARHAATLGDYLRGKEDRP